MPLPLSVRLLKTPSPKKLEFPQLSHTRRKRLGCAHIYGVSVRSGPLRKTKEWGFPTCWGSVHRALFSFNLVLQGKVPNHGGRGLGGFWE